MGSIKYIILCIALLIALMYIAKELPVFVESISKSGFLNLNTANLMDSNPVYSSAKKYNKQNISRPSVLPPAPH